MKDEDEALAVSQDVFVQLLRRRGKLKVRSPSNLLYRMATNLSLNRIRDRQRKPTTNDEVLLRSWPMTAFLGAVAALILAVVFLPRDLITTRPGEDAPIERIKGEGPRLELRRKTPDGSEALEAGARVYPGDIIRIGYQAAGRSYGVHVSADGRGTVTLHLPDRGGRSVRLKNAGQVLLDFALELDEAPRWERFSFVTGDTPFDAATVVRAAGQIDLERPVDRPDKLDLPKDIDQFVLTLEKATKP